MYYSLIGNTKLLFKKISNIKCHQLSMTMNDFSYILVTYLWNQSFLIFDNEMDKTCQDLGSVLN